MAGKTKNEKKVSQPRKRGIPLSVIYADSFYGLNSFTLFNCFSPTSQVLLSSVSFIICFFYHLYLLSSVSFIICFFYHLFLLSSVSFIICSLYHLFLFLICFFYHLFLLSSVSSIICFFYHLFLFPISLFICLICHLF